MSALRNLGISYLAAASVFTMAAALSTHRALINDWSVGLRQDLTIPALDWARAGDSLFGGPVRLKLPPPGPNDMREFARAVLPPMPHTILTSRMVENIPMPVMIAPDLPDMVKAVPPEIRLAAAPPAGDDDLTPEQRVAVTARLKENLTAEMRKNFSLFLYVSKAPSGPLAQRLYVFKKKPDGSLALAYDWAASTGREKIEVSPRGRRGLTTTPRGYYELDPDRMYPHYRSYAWNQPMPYAMFFNWENHGEETGLAIHAASGADIQKLGSRASAGCVHLSPEHARQLYTMIRADYRGPTPRFAFDQDSQSMSNKGELMHDADGRLKMADGYRVMIFIENFGGGKVVAALD